MKDIYFFSIIVIVFNSVFVGCTADMPLNIEPDQAKLEVVDTLKTRTSEDHKKRLSVKEAFIKLSRKELVLDGIQNMSSKDRRDLLQQQETDNYHLDWVGNYLQITEKAANKDDEYERMEQIRLAVFNSITQKDILFVSQELIDEQRHNTQIVDQAFFQYNNRHWENINYQLPLITTQTFLNQDNNLNINENHIYFNLKAADIHYLQAHLNHENYLNKDEIAQNEAYKVALIWTGNNFRLNRQAIVQYDISERHPR
ncbi:hypothetical protein [Aureispira anguillae]|uniref:Lipoprotein n=1 Tax=Aureispira anguillae TaxID=2864201 RepID=A0A915YLJ2_9BACT|nr:hypothetical protein [Aureispira anguillae]BDS15455.1 hypothetical protein AsAng_0062390 [Aureispira anguillae]